MTYLELINQVLIRLREPTITDVQVDSNPFLRSIGAHVNDAKDRVEDAWQWSQLRDREDIDLLQNELQVSIPNSRDNNTVIRSILVREKGHFLRSVDTYWMKSRYANNANTPVPSGTTGYWGFGQDDIDGNKQITLYPPAAANWTLDVDLVRHQDRLVNADDRLKVPSLPVYSLATALASRERGEVGGTPTSELFVVADGHLADAIAYDSARFPEDMDWYADTDLHNTNVRFS